MMHYPVAAMKSFLVAVALFASTFTLAQDHSKPINLSTSKRLSGNEPGSPKFVNSLPETIALSPDKRYAVLLNSGFGTDISNYHQSLTVYDLQTDTVKDFPDERLPRWARQTYFCGLVFSDDGKHLYASIGSITDPEGAQQDHKDPNGNPLKDIGDGIAVYRFENGAITPENFLKIPLQPAPAGKMVAKLDKDMPAGKTVSFPAGLAFMKSESGSSLMIAANLSDQVLRMELPSGNTTSVNSFSPYKVVPSAYPYGITCHGETCYVSYWNASRVGVIEAAKPGTQARIPLRLKASPLAAGTHPSSLLLNKAGSRLYVALANDDSVAEINTQSKAVRYFSVRLPGQREGGSYPLGLALSTDEKTLFVANASTNSIAVVDVPSGTVRGFIPSQWYPLAIATVGDDLLIATGKGIGVGPNNIALDKKIAGSRDGHPYIPGLMHGSIARVHLAGVRKSLAALTRETLANNRMSQRPNSIPFLSRKNPIKHVIYVMKENRTYDQVFGDLPVGNGDKSLTLFGADITPNQHRLALQFGVLDNFYDSGEVSGNGHDWSTAAITSDYLEKTWQIGYRGSGGSERTYDYQGQVANRIPMEDDMPDVNEPSTGYLWTLAAKHGLTYRHYGEFVSSFWCLPDPEWDSPEAGTPGPNTDCSRQKVEPGEEFPAKMGGGKNLWPWAVPILREDRATKPELRGHFDPNYPDFKLTYPDQLRADEFLREFQAFVKARETGTGVLLPNYVFLYLPNDHTAAARANNCTPAACVADNDLALGRVVDAVSHSPYWEDTAILVLEDDAQAGADHVDAHRSIGLVISKYSPSSAAKPVVDSNFYTTVSIIHTLEVLLGLPPMNNNDAHAPVIGSLFAGKGDQPAFAADHSNRESGLIYQMNKKDTAAAKASAGLNLSHPDSVDPQVLNSIVWQLQMGDRPQPRTQHNVFPAEVPQD
jgi:DNA-binding beta-propeller fold protein YncE